ncbi:FTR1 family iron permease [Serratia symbiotica]|uniref:Iron permease n=1 Tax=Serratia symbiotica TaxID=138074 RepID=A0A068Z7M4_9GAMM|nr:FTR1 family protein [Serratia symbiotica]QLH64584.1 iron permease [Serratia symbiotica]CDS57079.1 Iron transporter FTR1 [Serratia symbiotica]
MLAALIIVFREVLEAGLIISVILAACKGVPVRKHVLAGVLAGMGGAVIMASFTDYLESMLDGRGLEIFSASVLLLAVLMLSWQVLWISSSGKRYANSCYREAERLIAEKQGYYSIAILVALTVLREGAEIVLFLYSLSLTATGSAGVGMLVGGITGVLLGILVSWSVYSGLVLISLRTVFAASNLLLMFIAAGLASQAAGILASVDVLPMLGWQIWDTSFLLSDSSWAGILSHTLLGYTATPSGIQFCAWFLVFVGIFFLRFYLLHREQH